MPSRHRAVGLVALGAVLGLLTALLIAIVVWPDDDDERATPPSTTGRTTATTVATATVGTGAVPELPAWPAVTLPVLDLGAANRRDPLPGLPDWSGVGYRGGQPLPGDAEMNPDPACRVTADELASEFGVEADDGSDDTEGLQHAIDAIRTTCSVDASYESLSSITLPAGVLDVSAPISVDADYLVVRGAGAQAPGATVLVFRPDADTAYDTLTDDGADWDEDAMEHDDGSGGWLWPGRGVLRVQSRVVHEDYAKAYASAPRNRRDLFEGTVNVHWKAGVELREAPGGDGFASRAGDTVVPLADDADTDRFTVGGLVNIRAANTMAFYEQQEAVPTDFELRNLHMRQQLFTVTAVDADEATITIDRPLEFDVPVDSTSDGSAEIDGDTYLSKASPLVDPVVGVGLADFAITQVEPGLAPGDAADDYANLAPAREMHGVVFKWAADSWVRGVATYMTGSHPIVTEEAKNLEIVGNYFDGAWNKGAGGNGYLRGSRVWDSLYAGNIVRNLRHVTFQWSASGNVFIGNDVDADLNLHGGWERRNLFELNTVRVAAGHRPGNCSTNCGGEGGADEDGASWYPVWWGAGQKAVKWSGATGPQNVSFNNTMTKQVAPDGPFVPYYAETGTVFQFGWDGTAYRHLAQDGAPITDWAGREDAEYRDGDGVDATLTDPGPSLFLVTL